MPNASLLIGLFERREFTSAVSLCKERTETVAHRKIEDAIAWADAQKPVPILDAIYIFQSYSGQYSQAVLEQLQRRYPITPIVAIIGPWCEGEQRTGSPLITNQRVYSRDFC
ncbi:MAG: hypothetical protein ACRC2T_18120 [Thermoguttaceae bacterium]